MSVPWTLAKFYYLITVTWLWRHHILQVDEDVSCQFWASSLSSMSTLSAASFSSSRAFPVQEPAQMFNKRTIQSASSKTKEIYIKNKIDITVNSEVHVIILC